MGDNFYLGDRNGCRTPMQWSPDRNAGFSRANPQQLYLPITIDPEYHYEPLTWEKSAKKNLSSLLWWTRRVIAMRKNFKAFSRGSLNFLSRQSQGSCVPSPARGRNHSGDSESLALCAIGGTGSSRFSGYVPMEVFSRNLFRPIRKSRYVITLGPHAHYWFALHAPTDGRRAPRKKVVPIINAPTELGTAADK